MNNYFNFFLSNNFNFYFILESLNGIFEVIIFVKKLNFIDNEIE